MSEALITQWKDRVLEAETEIGLVQDDINAALEKRKAIKQDSRKHTETIEKEKKELLKKLEAVEAEAKQLSVLCDKTLSEKDRVEAVYVSTLDEYESMHYLVHEIKNDEERLSSREDLETRLQRESLAWAEEEHTLRAKLGALQLQLKQIRKQQQQEVADLEADLAAAEKRLRQERTDRAGEVKQQARSVVRSSRQVTPAPMANATASSSSSAAAVNSKESSFLAANTNGSVPTRNVALRSCLKTSGPGANLSTVSAPVSRAGSQSLVTDAHLGAGQPHVDEQQQQQQQQPSLAMMRAYSYGPGKRPSRKRDILGESTNQQ